MSESHTDNLIPRQPIADRDELFRYADNNHPLIAALYDLAVQPVNDNGVEED